MSVEFSIRMASRQLLVRFVGQWNATVKQLGVFSPCFLFKRKDLCDRLVSLFKINMKYYLRAPNSVT